MVRVITQETYDEIVKENMEEFEMTPEEAVKEAIAQFEAQGVDLSNIIKDLALTADEDHLVTTTVNKLKNLCSTENIDKELIMKELDVLRVECTKDIAHRIRAGKEGAYKLLIDLLCNKPLSNDAKDLDFQICVMNALCAFMEMQPDFLDENGVNLIKNILDQAQNESLLIATLRWTSTCCVKHEMNRQKLFAKNIYDNINKFIASTQNKKLLSECLQVIRKLTLDDDIRVEFGKAHEHAREMGIKLLVPLTNLLKNNTKPPLVSELMLTIASLLVRHELCKMVADTDISVLFNVLSDNYDNEKVIQQACKLVTALAGNDEVKKGLVKSGIVPILIPLLSRHSSNEITTALLLKTVAALSLREPEHSKQFLEGGAPEAIVSCMQLHQNSASVQKNACWAIRNMVARCRDHNSKFLELGAEALLNSAYQKFEKEFGFDIKSALRDLECDVKLDEQWKGRGVQMRM